MGNFNAYIKLDTYCTARAFSGLDLVSKPEYTENSYFDVLKLNRIAEKLLEHLLKNLRYLVKFNR